MTEQRMSSVSDGTPGIVNYRIGGLGSWRATQELVDAPTIYFSDAGFTPYARISTAALRTRLQQIFNFLYAQGAQHIACTHYPAIAREIQVCLDSETRLIDPSRQMAEWIVENWDFKSRNAPDRWFTSGDPIKLAANGRRAFGVSISNPVHMQL